jgi:hypothetical protein
MDALRLLHGTRSNWTGRRAMGAVLALMLALLIIGPTALAVHDDGTFELDGNATASAAPGDDWSNISSNAIAFTGILHDGADPPTDTTYLHTGDSKDIADFADWVRTTTDEAPDKDEIVDAFAAGYTNADGDLVVYFGMDRFDASGDSQVGFWFAQEPVTIVGDDVQGHHQNGDILVLSDFVTGGSVPEVRVFKWVGSGGSDGPIDEVTTSGSADCNTAPANDKRCAIVNAGTVNAPWAFEDKSHSNDFLAGEFYEGGINLTALGIDQGCITTFIAETRTSQSTDARLKDIAMGGFPLCGVSVTKTGDSLSKVTDTTHYTVTVTNTGAIKLYKESIDDSILGDLTDGTDANIDSSTCGASLDPGDSCVIHLHYVVPAGSPDPLVNTVDISYNNKANFTGTDLTDSDSWSTNLFQPSVTIDKSGDTLSKVGDPVHYTFKITNTSSSDSPDLILDSINDDVIGSLMTQATAAGCDQLAPGDDCTFNVQRDVQADDPNPLVNVVTVHYHPEGFPNDIHATDSHSVRLFGPSVTIEKTGDELGKIGDTAHYHFKITNTSTEGAPDLLLATISDNVIGDLKAAATTAGCDTLSVGESCEFNAERAVQAGDSDPLVNRVDVLYHPEGFPNDITAFDTHSLNLFQPSVTIDKSADTDRSKVGDTVTYTFKITNTSSDDSPDLLLATISDDVLGDLKAAALAEGCGTLAPKASCEFSVEHVVSADDLDPLNNRVDVLYHPEGFPNDITAFDTHSLNLFQPSVTIDKTGDELGKIGDPAHYSFHITNTSSEDSPDLQLDTISDNVIGDLKAAAVDAGCGTLAPGADCTFTADRVVVAGDADPLVNRVDVLYHPEGFPNDITAFDTHSLNLFQPSVAVTKSGPATVTVGQPLTYTFTVTNTSSADSPPLNIESMTDVGTGWAGLGDLTDEAKAAGCGTLAPGASCTFKVTITAPASPDPLGNAVSVLYHPNGFPNNITARATHSLRLIQVLPRKLVRTGTDVGTFLALGIALTLAGAGLKYLAFAPAEE